jgi:hypothetical protein
MNPSGRQLVEIELLKCVVRRIEKATALLSQANKNLAQASHLVCSISVSRDSSVIDIDDLVSRRMSEIKEQVDSKILEILNDFVVKNKTEIGANQPRHK